MDKRVNEIRDMKPQKHDANGNERLVYFHIGPKFGSVSKRAVNNAVQNFRGSRLQEGASWLVLLGFSFEDSIEDKDYNLGDFTVSKVRMHDDLMQDGLLKKDKGAGSFITIGEPDIVLVVDSPDSCHVEIRGLDIYDPIKDDVRARNLDEIAYWEIDDDYMIESRQTVIGANAFDVIMSYTEFPKHQKPYHRHFLNYLQMYYTPEGQEMIQSIFHLLQV